VAHGCLVGGQAIHLLQDQWGPLGSIATYKVELLGIVWLADIVLLRCKLGGSLSDHFIMLTLSIIQYVGLLGLSTVSGVLAAPNVTAVPLAGGCSVYPMWEYRGIVNQTGPFQLRLISTDNPSANGVVSVVEVQRRTAMQVQWGTVSFNHSLRNTRVAGRHAAFFALLTSILFMV